MVVATSEREEKKERAWSSPIAIVVEKDPIEIEFNLLVRDWVDGRITYERMMAQNPYNSSVKFLSLIKEVCRKLRAKP